MSKRPLCPICGIGLEHEYVTETLPMGATVTHIQQEHVQFWMHNPANPHEDILVPAHKMCVDKAKAVYPNFDQPTEADLAKPTIPTINEKDEVVLAVAKTITKPTTVTWVKRWFVRFTKWLR